jgi:hypothetical protein
LTEKERARQEKIKDNASFLKSQMEERGVLALHGRQAQVTQKKYTLGGQMNAEEMRMNKGLLREIADKKR